MKLSDLRMALMADRTGSLRLEAWAKSDDAPDSVKAIVGSITTGRKQKTLAEDGWHFAAIGRFAYADANFKALDDSNPDPVALLELARANPNRHAILIKLLANADVGPSAQRFLEILGRGEEMLRMDPQEIAANVAKLSGPPRMSFNAASRLKDSGEYAVPHLIQLLQDPNKRSLHPAIIQLLPQIGRAALNPICIALGMDDNVTRQVLINAVAQIGYGQALPYLAKVADDTTASPDTRAAAKQAMATLGDSSADRSQLFQDLAANYYNNIDSLRADARRDSANIWYLRDGELRLNEVPTAIFNDIMVMRCSEEALLANPDNTVATALWIAANFRREAKLGMNVESELADALSAKDGTRPEGYPRAIYFARAAGPTYNHLVLEQAFKDLDPGVALGAIAALSETAGGPSLVGAEDIKQPLVQTLAFPNRQVRIKAALALGRALPKTSFHGAQNVVPVLAEALAQSSRSAALVVDPDESSGNAFAAILRGVGFDAAVGADLNKARDNGQKANLTSFDVILLATDMAQPDATQAVTDLRRDLPTAATPILIVAKEGQMSRAIAASRAGHGVDILPAEVAQLGDAAKVNQQVMARIGRAAQALGMSPLSMEMSMDLALQSADVLRMIGQSNLKVYDFSGRYGRITSLASPSETLRIRSAQDLALAASGDAQAAIGEAALNEKHNQAERVSKFASLAESARRNGNMLGQTDLANRLIDFTKNEKDLILRTAASQALGALDLPSNKASEIIRSQYRG
jgi:CheY-like chemotaxis protein